MASDKVAEALATLTAEVEKLQTSSGMAAWLAFQAKFWTYSPSNVLLIMTQRLDASQVAGFQRWRQLGRQVRAKEKGILILAPIFSRKSDDEDDADNKRPVRFRPAYLWDIAQTDPLEGHADVPVRPDIACPVLDGQDGGELYSALVRVAAAERITVSTEERDDTPSTVQGFYSTQPVVRRVGDYGPLHERRIWVRPNPPLMMVKVLVIPSLRMSRPEQPQQREHGRRFGGHSFEGFWARFVREVRPVHSRVGRREARGL